MLQHYVDNIRASGGRYAADWAGVLIALDQAAHTATSTASSSSTNAAVNMPPVNEQKHNQLLFQLSRRALFQHGVACDRNSGHVWTVYFESMLRLRDNKSNNNQQPQQIAAQFELALSLPIGERALQAIFQMLHEFIARNNNSSNNNSSVITVDIKDISTRVAAAIRFSREENKTWPLRLRVESSNNNDDENDAAEAAQQQQLLYPSLHNKSALASTQLARYTLREQRRYAEWAQVLSRRLQNPTRIRDVAAFSAFISVVTRQMLFEMPHCEMTHVAALLAKIVVDETFQNGETNQRQQKATQWLSEIEQALGRLAESRGILQQQQQQRFQLTPDTIALFPTLSAVFIVVSSEATGTPITAQLKPVTERICNNKASSASGSLLADSAGANPIVPFAWAHNLWKTAMVDAMMTSNADSTTTVRPETDLAAIIKEHKKFFRMPGKAAAAAGVADASFFADWALGEQLLLRDPLLLSDIFREAAATTPSSDPGGAAVVVRAATECYKAQRAEGPAGTVLKRAVQRVQEQQQQQHQHQQHSTATADMPAGCDTALWLAFSDFVASQNAQLQSCEEIENERRAAAYSGGVLSLSAVEDTTRRLTPSPAETYLWHLRQLSLGGGLVLPTSAGDLEWTCLLRDLEVARRSAVAESSSSSSTTAGSVASGLLLPAKPRQTAVVGFPSLQEFATNGKRAPAMQQRSTSGTATESHAAASTTTMVMPEFILGKASQAANAATANATTIAWKQLNEMPKNPNPPKPHCDPALLDDVTGPQSLRPQQSFILDRNTRAKIEREKAAEKERTRKALLQTLAEASAAAVAASTTTASHAAGLGADDAERNAAIEQRKEELIELLESLPSYLLSMTRAAIEAQNNIQQEELEAELSAEFVAPSRPIPSSGFVIRSLAAAGLEGRR